MDPIAIAKYIAAISAIGLTISILLQSSQGGGLGTVFGGGNTGGETYRTKRGAEALIFRGTIVFAIIFAVSSLFVAGFSV